MVFVEVYQKRKRKYDDFVHFFFRSYSYRVMYGGMQTANRVPTTAVVS